MSHDNEEILFCPHQNTTLDARDSRWAPDKVSRGLRWALTGSIPAFTQAALQDLLRRAFARISAVCGLTFLEASGDANIIVGTGPVDGPGNVLAWSNLPPADPCEQKYDTSERWNQSVNLLPVVLHELGHAVGLHHSPASGNLMSPTYSPNVQDFTADDIQRLQALYGPPVTQPPPPGTGNHMRLTVDILNADAIKLIDVLTNKRAKVTWPN